VVATRAVLVAGFAAAFVVLAFSYLSVREVSVGADIQSRNPRAALRHFETAAQLNPLNPAPGRLAGAVALLSGDEETAARRFKQSISAEPGGWFAWLGAGLAASALGEPEQAHHDFVVAKRINNGQPAIRDALQRVYTKTPLTSDEAFKLLVVVH
jgi:tetratricopeptide (TPR) repeat protein